MGESTWRLAYSRTPRASQSSLDKLAEYDIIEFPREGSFNLMEIQMKLIKHALFAAVAMATLGMAENGGGAEEAKKVKFAEKEYDLDTGVVTFTFGNGRSIEVDSNSFPEEIRKQLMLHGIAQKLGDSYAGAKGDYSTAIQNVEDIIEQLRAGVWRAARGEGDARPRLAELAEAIARIKGAALEAATAAVEKATDDQRKQWRSNAKVKAVIAQIRAEKAAKALEDAGEQELNVEV